MQAAPAEAQSLDAAKAGRGSVAEEEDAAVRLNTVNIQMLPGALHRAVFGGSAGASDSDAVGAEGLSREYLSKEHLRRHTIPIDAPRKLLPPLPPIKVPALLGGGDSIQRHFWAMGDIVSDEYFQLADSFNRYKPMAFGLDLSSMQGQWSTRTGWTRYALEAPFGQAGSAMGESAMGESAMGKSAMGESTMGEPLLCHHQGVERGVPVPFPEEAVVVLDVETCPSFGPWPLMAVAISERFIYSWVSPLLFSHRSSVEGIAEEEEEEDQTPSTPKGVAHEAFLPRRERNWSSVTTEEEMLIPLREDVRTLCIGHNVSYDRARIRGEYVRERGKRRFIDTLSMHSAVAGLSSQQRCEWTSFKKHTITDAALKGAGHGEEDGEEDLFGDLSASHSGDHLLDQSGGASAPREFDEWMYKSSMNNLQDAVRLHCGGYEMEKSTRDILVKGTIADVRCSFQEIMTYCANDVAATLQLYRVLWPKFLEKCPHPVTLAAFLEMGTCFLPVNGDWRAYVERAEAMYKQSVGEISKLLTVTVEDGAKRGMTVLDGPPCDLASVPPPLIEDEGRRPLFWQTDPWLSKLDWTPVEARYTKARLKSDGSYAANGAPRPIGNVAMFGKPAWYKKLWAPSKGAISVTSKTRILPYLLQLSWNGSPVHYIDSYGWCYRVAPGGAPDELPMQPPSAGEGDSEEALIVDPLYPSERYRRIPHKDRQGANVGSLMTKHHLKLFERGVITTPSDILKRVLDQSAMYSFWVSYRERIKEQFVVWDCSAGGSRADLPAEADAEGAPFASTAASGVIIPQMIAMGTVTRRAVDGTWMTASNPKATLVGSEVKAKVVAPPGYVFVGADVDSQELWISSLLGDGQFGFPGATAMGWMTLQGSKSDKSDLHSRTAEILGMDRDSAKVFTYGRIYGAGVSYAAELLQKFNPTMDRATAESKARTLYSATKGRQFYHGSRAPSRGGGGGGSGRFYYGGSESFMFNVLERIAKAPLSKTPALQCAISDALLSDNVKEQYLTSRVNWTVQSSGVDYLHMLVVSMAYLITTFAIDARLAITIHDEVRYLVREADRFRAALALQIANVWTRTMFAVSVGMTDLPLSVAFFSAIDIDTVLRKETTISCVTPSSTTPVAPGVALDIYQLAASLAPVAQLPDVHGQHERNRRRLPVRPYPTASGQSALHGGGPSSLDFLQDQIDPNVGGSLLPADLCEGTEDAAASRRPSEARRAGPHQAHAGPPYGGHRRHHGEWRRGRTPHPTGGGGASAEGSVITGLPPSLDRTWTLLQAENRAKRGIPPQGGGAA